MKVFPIGGLRRDGKILVRLVFPDADRKIDKLLTPEQLKVWLERAS